MSRHSLVIALALLPAAVLAADPPPPAPATAAAPAPASPSPATAAAATVPPGAPPAGPTPATASAPAEETFSSYAVLKGGWFGSASDYQGDSFSGSGTWELAVGTGRVFGVELGVGSMTTKASGLEVRTIPLLLSLRLQIPIAFVAPFAEFGGGAYFNRATVADRSVDDVTAGWHAGLGCDFHLGRLLLGAQARYMGIAPTLGAVGTVTLDRYDLLVRAGVRF